MEKIAFLFPGQGSQFAGMAKSFYDQHLIARQTFEEASDILGFDMARLCFEETLANLSKTENLQPAMLTASITALRVYIQEIGITPQFCAGHSLGEYSALTCAGVIRFADCLKLVRQRGMLSREIILSGKGAMSIIDGIDRGVVEQECEKVSDQENFVAVSCYNAPDQIAVSGCQDAVMELENRVLELGAQVTPLIGSAPFHNPLMQSAADVLEKELEKYTFSGFRYPVISNVTGLPYGSSGKAVEILKKQLTHPVRWQETMNYLKRKGVTLVIEMGPRNVLCNLSKANQTAFDTVCFEQKEDRTAFLEFLSQNEALTRQKQNLVKKCLAASVAVPNQNWDEQEYLEGVILPFKRLREIQAEAEDAQKLPGETQMQEALSLLYRIFETKRLPKQEQTEWFGQILDETGTNYLFGNFA